MNGNIPGGDFPEGFQVGVWWVGIFPEGGIFVAPFYTAQ